jgi:hypothetical protein
MIHSGCTYVLSRAPAHTGATLADRHRRSRRRSSRTTLDQGEARVGVELTDERREGSSDSLTHLVPYYTRAYQVPRWW